ncbi:MAG: carbohydrate kinase family protein [Pseudomonadota bacterium]|nr:carbohydrate kinase family protein [Pseudomonadota bacterium]
MTYDVITIGSATVDYFADTDSELIRIDTRLTSEALLAYPLGGKILIKELVTTTGGGGTNTAASFKRLGFDTAFLGRLGDDVLGDVVLKKLGDEGVPFIGTRRGQTGVSFVLNSIRDDRTILTHKGCNNEMEKADVPAFDSRWVYLSSMLERSWDTVVELLDTRSCRLDSRTCKLAFNPSTYQAAMGYDRLRVVTDQAALLVMNREEACMLLGIDPRRRVTTHQLIGTLAKVPGQIVAITDGDNGAWICADERVLSAQPLPGIRVMETTGAGDAFASTLTACHIRGLELGQALHCAMTNAESVLQHKGAKEKLLAWDELQAVAARQPREILTHTRTQTAIT